MNDTHPQEKETQQKETRKTEQLEQHTQGATEGRMTTDQGIPISDNQNSLKAGTRGGTLMEDFILREKMTHFDHERIPERVVHARGSAAHGYFQVYESMAEYTSAAFLQDPEQRTPVFVRFSTVVGSRGSADTVRDVRGFAVKFYTEEGNLSLVGNNIPVFFIQDAIKFPDLVHAIKPEPHHGMPQASAAHDNFWDFISLMPESMHMILWVLSDRALPRSYAMMEGFGVHTFRFINADGKSRFVKFHWKPLLGVHSLVWDEVQKIAGKDPDFNRRDLWQRIEMGDYPEWELGVQIVEEEDEHQFDFDLLDATKIIPEELVPVRRIGKMTLNRNPDDFFAETEQVAFHPGDLVPGIDFTNDPLLQGRLFSYLDTQLLRLGGPNFTQIPINRPLCPVSNQQRGGLMRQTIHRGRVNYEPSSLGGCPMHSPEKMRGFTSHLEKLDGHKVRERSASFADHFTQATLFWASQSEVEKRHMIEGFHFELGKVETMHIRQRMVELLANIDAELAAAVAAGIGVKEYSGDLGYLKESTSPLPNDRRGAAAPGKSAALSMMDTVKSARTRQVAILLENGYDADGLMAVKDALMVAGAHAKVVAKSFGMLTSMDGREVEVDMSYATTSSVLFDAVFVPGGDHVAALKDLTAAISWLRESNQHFKPIAAMGEATELLAAAGVTADAENGVVTGGEDSAAFAEDFIRAIAAHRHWGRAVGGVA